VGIHRANASLGTFIEAWKRACASEDCPGKLVQDLPYLLA